MGRSRSYTLTTGELIFDRAREAIASATSPSILPVDFALSSRNCWDRVALDQKLGQICGMSANMPDDVREPALERWRRNKKLSRDVAEAEELGRRME